MKTRDFATRHIVFNKTSPVTGPFRLERYPFLGAPMDASDNIRIKRLVIYKASSCLGTILGQIINAKRIACDVGDQIMVCQTDDDASKWTKTRGKEWLESIPDVMRLLKNDKYAQTNDLWLFRHKFLIITGPAITAAQSDQVRYVQTDESHLDAYPPGRLVEFEKRMGARFDRQATHITTAANVGKEVDGFYYQGSQNEWHWRCPKCSKLVWPLWEKYARDLYNGERIFRWTEYPSDTMTLESIHAICPYCQYFSMDTSRDRYALQRDADYVSKNPTASKEYASFRWSALSAAHWMPWREMLSEYRAALEAAKQGNLKPYEDWEKKRLCKSYTPTLPDFGNVDGVKNYMLGHWWNTGDQEKTRILTADYQAGKKGEGSHLWALATDWLPNGDSRRVMYERVDTWAQLRVAQLDLATKDGNTYVDCGHDDRTVFQQCGRYHWYAVQGSHLQQFHTLTIDKGTPNQHTITVPMPYSQPERASGIVGMKQPNKLRAPLRGALPPGWCLKIVMGNDQIYSILHALHTGEAERYFGIASDISPDYTATFPAFIPVIVKDKATNLPKKHWKLVKPAEHAWDLECMSLLGAMRAECYPLADVKQLEESKHE